jgi:hypothetical protein
MAFSGTKQSGVGPLFLPSTFYLLFLSLTRSASHICLQVFSPSLRTFVRRLALWLARFGLRASAEQAAFGFGISVLIKYITVTESLE